MRKNYTLFLVLFITSATWGQSLFNDDFTYAGNLNANGWTVHSGTTNFIATTTGLTYAGLQGSGIGNAALVNNLGGEDINRTYTNQNTNGQSIYYSAMVNVTDPAATKTGDYFLLIGTPGGATFTLFAARVFVRITATGVNFGISNTSTAAYGPTNFLKNTTYFLVVKYTINTGGNDDASLWIIPSGVPATEAAAGTAELTSTTTLGQDQINTIAFRQGSGTTSVQTVVDALKVGLTWADVAIASGTPSLSPSPASLAFGNQAVSTQSTSQSFNLSGSNLTGSPGNITVTSPSTDFEVSNDNAAWGPSTTIAYATSTLSSTPVYTRFTPQSGGAKGGNVTFSGGGVSIPPTVAVSGTGTITYYSKNTGSLATASNWGIASDGMGSSPLDFISDGQVFIVANRTTTTLDAIWTVSGSGSKVVTGDGSNPTELTIPTGFALTGTVDVANNGSLIMQNPTLPTIGALATGSTVEFAQSGTYVLPARTYYNLTLKNGTKTLAAGTTTVNGQLRVDAVTGFNGAGSPFSTLDLAGGYFQLVNGATFDPNPTGDGNRITLIASASLTTFTGGNFELFRLQTPATPVASHTIQVDGGGAGWSLLLGNSAGGGLNLQQSTDELWLLPTSTLTIRGGGVFSSTNVGTIHASSTSNLVIDKTSGSAPIGSIGFTSGFNTLNNLTVNSAGTGNNNLSILSNLTLNGTLTLTSGRIVIPTGIQIELTTTNLSGTGFGAAKHIVTSVNTTTGVKGTLRVDGIAAVFTFPVGDGTNYLPVTVTPSSVNDFTVCAFSGITDNGEPNGAAFNVLQKDDVVDAVWQVGRFNASGDATLTTSWPSTLEGATFSTYADNIIGIAHNNGSVWGTVSGTGDNALNTATRTGITTFSPFGVGQVGQILPVNFGTVKATQQSNTIKVDWNNLTETEVVNYSIERSADGRNFTSIGNVNARLNNGGKADYSFIDPTPLSGVNYYRIRSLETTGKLKYSIIVKVDIRGGATQLVLYPNPSTGGQLSYQANNLLKGQYTLRIFNSVGQQVYSKALNHPGGSVTEAIVLPVIQPGIYSMQLISDDNNFVKTFVVQ